MWRGKRSYTKINTEAKGFPEPKKNLNLKIKGLRFRLLNPKGEGKILLKAKNLRDRRKKVTYKQKNQAGSTLTLRNGMLEVMCSEL